MQQAALGYVFHNVHLAGSCWPLGRGLLPYPGLSQFSCLGMGFSLGVIPGLIQINAFLRAKQTVGELAKVSRTGAAGFKQGASAKQLVCLLLQGGLAQVALKAYSRGRF